MDGTELCFTPAADLARLIRTRELSPVEVTDAFLARIDALNPRVNAYCTVVPERARAAAAEAERQVMRGAPLGPLHGVPIALKDGTQAKGMRGTSGSRLRQHEVAQEDAAVVTRIKAAGAIVLGKTNMPEFGLKLVTDNRLFGVTRNPWNLAMVAGGSTGGGAAALAAGLAPLAQGSDLGGSCRVPAALCGVVGLKPTAGRVAKYPGESYSPFSVIGPLARTVRDTAALFGVMCGFDDRDPISLPDTGEDFPAACDAPLGRLRIGWSQDLGYAAVDPRVAAIAGQAARSFAGLGADVRDDAPVLEDPEELFRSLVAPLVVAHQAALVAEHADEMDPHTVEVVRWCESALGSAIDFERLNTKRGQVWRAFAEFFDRFDLLATPTTALAAFPVDDPYPPQTVAGRPVSSELGWCPFTYPMNLLGLPAISVPAGWTDDGLPVGLQLVGRRCAEATLLRAAAAYEAARPWADRRPPV